MSMVEEKLSISSSRGEKGFKESPEEVMLAGTTNMSEHLYRSDTKAATDKFDDSSYRDWEEPGGLSPGSVSGIDAIKSYDQNSYR
jgi:hypothetical protein